MHCHQTRWSYYHLNCHQFWQIPKKITLWGEIKSDKIVTWIFTKYGDHTITLIITHSGSSPENHHIGWKKRWTNHHIDRHQIQANSPQNHIINPNRSLVHLILTGTAKKPQLLSLCTTISSSPWEEPHFVLLRSSILKFAASMTGARQGWGSSHGLDEIEDCSEACRLTYLEEELPLVFLITFLLLLLSVPLVFGNHLHKEPSQQWGRGEGEEPSKCDIWHRQRALTSKYGPDPNTGLIFSP